MPGFAKTRLIAALGPEGAAALQARLTERALVTSIAARIGPVTLWCAPDHTHPAFQDLAARHDVKLACQPDGDLGARMLAALTETARPALVIGTDCPALTPGHLREAAQVLHGDRDVVFIPVEDGGYALIGTRQPFPALFHGMTWSTPSVMAETRDRLTDNGLTWRELEMLWDVDRPEDLDRLRRGRMSDLVGPST